MVGFAVYLAWLFYKIPEAYLNQELARRQEGPQKAQHQGQKWDHQISAEPGQHARHNFETDADSELLGSFYSPAQLCVGA